MTRTSWTVSIATVHGTVVVTVTEGEGLLHGIALDSGESARAKAGNDEAGVPGSPWRAWLDAYARREPVPVATPRLPRAATSFQQRLRRALLAIPFGETRTYGDVAAELESSPRAVGRALASNPLPLVVPCHRVVARGGPGGFQGGRTEEALRIKAGLLAHEGGHGVG